jgi:hypothetical protein
MPVSGLPPYDDGNVFAKYPARRDPVQEGLRGQVGAGVSRRHANRPKP